MNPNAFLETWESRLGTEPGLYPARPGLPERILANIFPAEFLAWESPGLGETSLDVLISDAFEGFYPATFWRGQFALRLTRQVGSDPPTVDARHLATVQLSGAVSGWAGTSVHTFSHAPVVAGTSYAIVCEYLRFQAHDGAPWEVFSGDLLPVDSADAALWA